MLLCVFGGRGQILYNQMEWAKDSGIEFEYCRYLQQCLQLCVETKMTKITYTCRKTRYIFNVELYASVVVFLGKQTCHFFLKEMLYFTTKVSEFIR